MKPCITRLVGEETDIWVIPEQASQFAVKRGRNTWPLNVYSTRDGAVDAARELARVWRCTLYILDASGNVEAQERHRNIP